MKYFRKPGLGKVENDFLLDNIRREAFAGILKPARCKFCMNHCLVVVVGLFPVEVRLECSEVEEGGEKVEEDLAYSGRANNLGQSDVVEALEVNSL